jgi:hypothetical protein
MKAAAIVRSAPIRAFLRETPGMAGHLMKTYRALSRERRNTGGSTTAPYCYSVWLRHLSVLARFDASFRPATILEYGPGDSIGIGLAALICGAEVYYGLDAEKYASPGRDADIFEELVNLFQVRSPIPTSGLSEVKPALPSYDFPSHILEDDRMHGLLDRERLSRIRSALRERGASHGGFAVQYIAPWDGTAPIPAGGVDLALSQAVLEHVEDPAATYRSMGVWVRRGGYVSHQIDLRSHGTSFDWNGHWTYSERQWETVRNSKTYRFINREPASVHLALMRANGFEILSTIPVNLTDGIKRRHLAERWAGMSDEDFVCSGIHVLARRS